MLEGGNLLGPAPWWTQKAHGAVDLNAQVATNTFEFIRALMREMVLTTSFSMIGGNEVVSGSGATNTAEGTIYTETGTTHASTAGRRHTVRLPTAGGTNWSSINWGKRLFVAFTVLWDGTSMTNLTLRAQLTQATTISNLAAHGLGFQTNGANINLATYGANGSQELVSAAQNMADDKRLAILIEHDPASAVRLYINGVLAATQSTAGDIPSTEPSAIYYFAVSVARSGGADVANEAVRYENFLIGQEL